MIVCASLRRQFLAFAEKQGTISPAHDRRIASWAYLCCIQGTSRKARAHLRSAIALYDPAEHRPLATRFGVDARVAILAYRSLALWLLGYPEAALADAEHALKDAREIGQARHPDVRVGLRTSALILCGNYSGGRRACSKNWSRWLTKKAPLSGRHSE